MSLNQYTYKSISTSSDAEFKDRGSRFIAYAFPVSTLEEIKRHIKSLKELHPKAVHHCFAWRLGNNQTQYRANDDGEPSGSAGKPILGQLDSAGLTNTLIVVVRYFGGVLLGVPGLINAYKTSSQLALAETTILEKNIEVRYQLEFDYTIMNEVMRIMKQYPVTIIHQEMQLFCIIEIGIALAQVDIVLQKLHDIRSIQVRKVD